ncbi:type II secretion system protein [Candidatus Peregrinibacteria bacterium]|nr:type II secretion system protein [Candidatus Peregrinibacteria bacterium]
MTEKHAFTLVELLIAITVFSIFIAFGMTAFTVFHSAQVDAATSRDMMFELNQNMELINEAVRENKIDFEASDEKTLALLSADASEKIVFVWDAEAETLSLQKFSGEDMEYEAVLHSPAIKVKNLNFRIFPSEDPYDFANKGATDFYQPNVKVKMTYATPGRGKPEIAIDFATTVTSRIYQ